MVPWLGHLPGARRAAERRAVMLPVSDSQWAAVRETERHLLVSAGAGSGKTHTVVAGILYLLGEPIRKQRVDAPLALSDIAAITYTTKAAADLKADLREALRECGRRRAAYEVDTARIGTIHSFCGEILREFALRTGRPPPGSVLEEGEAAALCAEAVRDTLIQALDAAPSPDLVQLLARHSIRDVERWVGELVSQSDRLRGFAARGASLGPAEHALVDLAAMTLDRIERRLLDSGRLDFDRMITWTRDLVRDHKGVRRSLQRRIRVLIVDEFQDVDPAQRELAYLLGDVGVRNGDGTRLVLVGDPKQSIYRFRRADVRVWRDVEADFRERALGAVVTLEESWRSTPAILGFVDATVGALLDTPIAEAGPGPDEIAYVPLRAARSDIPASPHVELLVVPAGSDGKAHKAGDIRLAEARAVAARARELHHAGTPWSDMALLFCSLSDSTLYSRALAAAGVPFYAMRQEGFYERRETMDLIVALEAIRDPGDDRALAGFLRSPFVGASDVDLLRLARGGTPWWPRLRDRVRDGAATPELARGAALLERFAALRDRLPTGELLRLLLEESGYLAHLALLGDDDGQPLANIRQFVRSADVARGLALGDFLRAIRESRGRKDRVGEARLRGAGENVVTISTVHSAKGLDWRVVFWCDLYRGRPTAADACLIGRDGLVLDDVTRDEHSEEWTALRDAIQLEERAEQRRLWYVAATRAKDRLIISGLALGTPHATARESPAVMLASRLAGLRPGTDSIEYVGRDGIACHAPVRWCEVLATAADDDGDARLESASPDTQRPVADVAGLPPLLVPVQVPRGLDRHSATELLTWSRCPRRHGFRYVLGLREPRVQRDGDAFIDAVARGLIVHDVLEHLREDEELDELLDSAIGRWDPDAPPPDTTRGSHYRTHLREEIALVADHPDYRALASAPGARRELAFVHLDAGGHVLHGQIDLAASSEDEVVLLDVKTNQDGGDGIEATAERYAIQRAAYVRAVEAIGPSRVARFVFQFSRAARQVSCVIDDPLRNDGQRLVGDLLGRLGVGTPALAASPTECEYCGYRRVGWCPGAGAISSLGAETRAEPLRGTSEMTRP